MVPQYIHEILGEMDVEVDGVSAATTLGEPQGLGMDSQEIVELVCHIEERFGVVVPDSYLSRSTTIGQVVDLVESGRLA